MSKKSKSKKKKDSYKSIAIQAVIDLIIGILLLNKVKGFKLKGDVAERFAEACEKAGVSQAEQITKMMEEFIKEVEDSKG